jgi:hypothetical protein
MATATVINIMKQIRKLSPSEKEELQNALGSVLRELRPKATELQWGRITDGCGNVWPEVAYGP